eukprot:COSAG05_NODE_3978_length_1742_cov_1.494827_1_plen_76_part_00
MHAMKYEKNEQARSMLKDKIAGYLARVEFLDKKQQQGGGTANKPQPPVAKPKRRRANATVIAQFQSIINKLIRSR